MSCVGCPFCIGHTPHPGVDALHLFVDGTLESVSLDHAYSDRLKLTSRFKRFRSSFVFCSNPTASTERCVIMGSKASNLMSGRLVTDDCNQSDTDKTT